MKLNDFYGYNDDVIDVRPKKGSAASKGVTEPEYPTTDSSDKGDPAGPRQRAPKELIDEPTGDIGSEMQPAMRGYGKVQKKVNQWKVR